MKTAQKTTNTTKAVLVYHDGKQNASVFFGFDDRATHIMAAFWTNFMRWNGVTAFRAIHDLLFFFVIV